MDGRFVLYFRVSTGRQGTSGLGLEAQRAAAAAYLNGGAWEVVGEFTEVESGKRSDRPKFREAMDLCRLTGAKLLIAKLDRLSRNLHFITGLIESKVEFVACDMPTANNFTIHIFGAAAEHEAKMISERTKAGLHSINERIKAEGSYVSRSGRTITRLGNPAPHARPDHAAGTAAVKAKADDFAKRVLPVIEPMRAASLPLQTIADRLNGMRVQTARGAAWTPMAVKRVLDRAA